PEKAGRHTLQVGPATDVYPRGAVLYEMLTGHPPFKGRTALETLQQVLWQEPAFPPRQAPKLPRDLEAICLTCLQKEAHRRYPSADALAGDLRAFLAGESNRARRAPGF